ncbi:MAG: hypothetical protein R2795_10290 [Saprospiraceae bacterium]
MVANGKSVTAAERYQQPYEGFMSNNFVVPRSVLLATPMDASLLHYGHEDTLFGWQLAQKKTTIVHLDNPVLHIGLEVAEAWLAKQQQAITNLYALAIRHPGLSTKAWHTWRRLHRLGLMRFIVMYAERHHLQWIQNLSQQQPPNLRLLDLLKLYWLEQAHRKHK